jgi:hypothetical protein
MVRLGLGLLLFYLSLSLVIALLRIPGFESTFLALASVLGVLWGLYSKVPDWLQELLRSLWKRKENNDD